MTRTRDHLLLYVNGEPHAISGADAFRSLADFLRRQLGLVATKVACGQGGCGACSVLIGRPQWADGDTGDPSRLVYRTFNACIVFLYQLDLVHVVTLEGIATPTALSPVQQSLVDHHGSQCGFCTPGFAVALMGLFEDRASNAPLGDGELRAGLSGNLCRCTGYLQILEAGRHIDPRAVPPLDELHPARGILDAFSVLRHDEVRIEEAPGQTGRSVLIPRTLDSAIRLRCEYPEAVIVAGGTGFVEELQASTPASRPLRLLCLGSLSELTTLECHGGALVCGALVTWSEIQRRSQVALPALAELAAQLGCPQIRNQGTLGGNAMSASSCADSLPLLLVSEAEFELTGPGGVRRVGVADFYASGEQPRGKRPRLAEGELLSRISIPQLADNEHMLLYRVSRRRQLDTASFTAAIRLVVEDQRIQSARVSIGGVGPPVQRLPETEAFLTDRVVGGARGREAMRAAGLVARSEIAPQDDVRGSASFRAQLAENIFLKAHHDLEGSG